MLTYFIVRYLKIHISSDLIRKVFMYWEIVKLIVVDKIFLNSIFHLEALIFIGTSYCVFCLFWNEIFTFPYFWENVKYQIQ